MTRRHVSQIRYGANTVLVTEWIRYRIVTEYQCTCKTCGEQSPELALKDIVKWANNHLFLVHGLRIAGGTKEEKRNQRSSWTVATERLFQLGFEPIIRQNLTFF